MAAVIMTWGTGFTRQIQESTEETANVQIICSTEVNFDITNACRTTIAPANRIQLTVKNDGTKNINYFIARYYISESEVYQTYLPGPLTSFNIVTDKINPNKVNTDATDATDIVNANVRLVEIIPAVTIQGSEVTCQSNIDSFGDLDADPLGTC